jgi:hypothetical protein
MEVPCLASYFLVLGAPGEALTQKSNPYLE